jgi:Ca-activated chloride channel homolog
MRASLEHDRRPLLIAAVFVLLLTSGLGAWPRALAALCPSIVVASSNEKSALMTELANDYSATHRGSWSGCGPIVTVQNVASGDAERSLEMDWPGAGRPDVWAPAARTWVLLLQNKRPDLLPNVPPPSIATSPLVVAMPDSMARAMGWPDEPISWKELLDLANDPHGWGNARFRHPEWGLFRLGKTDPRVSTSGIHSLIATYYAATGKTSNLTLDDLSLPATVKFVADVEASVSHYAPTVGSFLDNLAAVDSLTYISALAVEEQEVFNYNEGGHSAQRPTEPPHVLLDAVYPSDGTLMADHPFVVLRAPWVDDTKQRIAYDFLRWLQLDPQQHRFTDEGFRNYLGIAEPPLADEPGIIPGQPTRLLRLPDASVVAAIRSSWGDLRKPARILIVLDLANATERAAVEAGVEELSAKDQVAVLALAHGGAPQVTHPISLGGGGRVHVLADIHSAPIAEGSGPLYETIQSAYRFLSKNSDASFINAVVIIASHRDNSSEPRLAALEREIGAQTGGTPVRVYTVALPGSDAEALLGIEKASGGVPSASNDPAAAIRTSLGNF